MKGMLLMILVLLLSLFACNYLDSMQDPYEEGTHFDYSIECENGFVYKVLSNKRGVIQVLNTDGTPMKCGEKRH